MASELFTATGPRLPRLIYRVAERNAGTRRRLAEEHAQLSCCLLATEVPRYAVLQRRHVRIHDEESGDLMKSVAPEPVLAKRAGWRSVAPAMAAMAWGGNHFTPHLTESLNLAERRHGNRACAVCGGEVATPILDKRPKPPSAAARAPMLQPEDLAQTLLFVATLPQRATVERLTMLPTQQRDWSDEVG
jgi:hypothetical protein